VNPSDTAGEKRGTPITGRKQPGGKRPNFKPRNIGPKPGKKPEPAGDEKSGSDGGKEGDDKTHEKEKGNDKDKGKDAD
jgi:hypothetical protein